MNSEGFGSDSSQKQAYPGKAKGPVMDKEKSSKSLGGAQGGSTHMFGLQDASPQVPGQSASVEGDKGGEWTKGGNGKMFHSGNGAAPQQSGTSSPSSGMGPKFAEGGKGHMFGPQTAGTATGGSSVK